MSVKKIRLKVASEKLVEVISMLFPDAVEVRICILQKESTKEDTVFTVYLEESKRTFTLLTVSEYIKDWEFDTEEDDEKIAASNPKPIILGPSKHNPPKTTSETPLNPDIQKALDKFMDKPVEYQPTNIVSELEIKSFNELATFIEAVWSVGMRSPGLMMKSILGWKKIKETYGEVASSPVSIDHALLRMIIENYYSGGLNISEATEDVIGKLEKLWKSMPNYTSLSSIAQALFRK